MNSTARSTKVAGLLDILGSFTEEKDIMARSIPSWVSAFAEIERQENPSARPGCVAFSLLIDEFKLGQVVHGLSC